LTILISALILLSVEVILTLDEIFLTLIEDIVPSIPKIIIITSSSISVKPLLSLLAGGKYFLFFVIAIYNLGLELKK
jgi:hypothetical protein